MADLPADSQPPENPFYAAEALGADCAGFGAGLTTPPNVRDTLIDIGAAAAVGLAAATVLPEVAIFGAGAAAAEGAGVAEGAAVAGAEGAATAGVEGGAATAGAEGGLLPVLKNAAGALWSAKDLYDKTEQLVTAHKQGASLSDEMNIAASAAPDVLGVASIVGPGAGLLGKLGGKLGQVFGGGARAVEELAPAEKIPTAEKTPPAAAERPVENAPPASKPITKPELQETPAPAGPETAAVLQRSENVPYASNKPGDVITLGNTKGEMTSRLPDGSALIKVPRSDGGYGIIRAYSGGKEDTFQFDSEGKLRSFNFKDGEFGVELMPGMWKTGSELKPINGVTNVSWNGNTSNITMERADGTKLTFAPETPFYSQTE